MRTNRAVWEGGFPLQNCEDHENQDSVYEFSRQGNVRFGQNRWQFFREKIVFALIGFGKNE